MKWKTWVKAVKNAQNEKNSIKFIVVFEDETYEK